MPPNGLLPPAAAVTAGPPVVVPATAVLAAGPVATCVAASLALVAAAVPLSASQTSRPPFREPAAAGPLKPDEGCYWATFSTVGTTINSHFWGLSNIIIDKRTAELLLYLVRDLLQYYRAKNG